MTHWQWNWALFSTWLGCRLHIHWWKRDERFGQQGWKIQKCRCGGGRKVRA